MSIYRTRMLHHHQAPPQPLAHPQPPPKQPPPPGMTVSSTGLGLSKLVLWKLSMNSATSFSCARPSTRSITCGAPGASPPYFQGCCLESVRTVLSQPQPLACHDKCTAACRSTERVGSVSPLTLTKPGTLAARR